MPPDFGGYMAAAAAVSAGYGNGYSPSSAAASTGPQHPAYKRPTGTVGASHPYQVKVQLNILRPKLELYRVFE